MSDIPPFALVGLEFSVADHVARAEFFLTNANNTSDVTLCNWLLLASVNSARAPIEIAKTDWDTIYKRGDPELFLTEAEQKIRRFNLIATIRVHDFHRQAIRLKPNAMAVFGPMHLKTGAQSNSSVGLSVDPQTGRLVETKTRNASISYERPLQTRGFEVFDFAVDSFVLLPKALEEYLADLKPFLQGHFPKIKWA